MNLGLLKYSFEWALRLFVAMAMGLYGIGKPMQFAPSDGISTPVKDLSGMELMWAFYGYSMPFVTIVGVLEILGGIMLLFERTKLIACFLLTTILTNIILQDIFYGVNQGALWSAVFYQIALLWILFEEKETVFKLFDVATQKSTTHNTEASIALRFAATVTLFFIVVFATRLITHNS